MTITGDARTSESVSGVHTQAPAPPSRFREAESRSRRLGRVVRLAGRVRAVDEDLMARIGQRMHAIDEPGSRLAHAMRMRADDPQRVTMDQFRTALHDGIEAIDSPPDALLEFFAEVEATPEWVDWGLVDHGARVFERFGQNAADVLLQLSLIGGYRFGGPTDLLVATGGLVGDQTRQRLADTQEWTMGLSKPNALRRDGEGWRTTVHVRAMHALVNHSFAPRWDSARWGQPINQSDQAATLGLFSSVLLIGVRSLGVRVPRRDADALMHLWKYVGWLLGIDDDWLFDRERDAHRFNYHVLLAQSDISPAGPQLAQAIVDTMPTLDYGAAARLQGFWARERLLSMLTTFLGVRSMRELGLGARPPWAFAYILPLNVARYHVAGRTPWGRRRLEEWGTSVRARIRRRYQSR